MKDIFNDVPFLSKASSIKYSFYSDFNIDS